MRVLAMRRAGFGRVCPRASGERRRKTDPEHPEAAVSLVQAGDVTFSPLLAWSHARVCRLHVAIEAGMSCLTKFSALITAGGSSSPDERHTHSSSQGEIHHKSPFTLLLYV